MDCIFCEIINNKIPCMKVYEDELTLVFMDIAKDVDGHMVAIVMEYVMLILMKNILKIGELTVE